jgi:uncharacterized protein
MKRWLLLLVLAAGACLAADPARVLVVTGRHHYPASFFTMLDSLPNVTWKHIHGHAEAFALPLEDRYDVLLLHDMEEVTTPQTRARLTAFLEAGKGVISLHHSIVDYTDWPYWYQEVTGGKFFTKPVEGHPVSHYHENVAFLVKPVPGKAGHPVLKGVGPLRVYDEMYRGMLFSPKIEVLMETDNPENDPPVVYVGPYAKARVIYIQLGHSDQTMQDPGFQRLMANAVAWAARRN